MKSLMSKIRRFNEKMDADTVCYIVFFLLMIIWAICTFAPKEEVYSVYAEEEYTVIEEEPVEPPIEYLEVFVEPVEDEPEPKYSEEDLDLLARLIYSEGGTESDDTCRKIGSIVLNRVASSLFPNTLREVIYQKNQFSVTTVRINGVIMIDRPADERCIEIAKDLLENGSELPKDVLVFYEKSIKESWVTSREPYGTYDNTTFAYIYERGAK